MPAGSKVDKIYKALTGEGMDKGKAARIAQSRSGQALATGKPPKGKKKPPVKKRRDPDMPMEAAEMRRMGKKAHAKEERKERK